MTIAQQFNHDFENGPFQLFDSNGNEIYYEDSTGFWLKREFDSNENEIYCEASEGYLWKREFDSNGNQIYYENSDGYWSKNEYDSDGNMIYHEDSKGNIKDNRPWTSPCNGKIIFLGDLTPSYYEIDGKKYELKEV